MNALDARELSRRKRPTRARLSEITVRRCHSLSRSSLFFLTITYQRCWKVALRRAPIRQIYDSYAGRRDVYETAKMVTMQDIRLQLTKPVRELAQWDFPFAQTLEQYCSLFNKTCNKSFGEAGLVLQSSTAVYVHRLDSLWTKIEYSRNLLAAQEQEEATKNPSKKRDRKTDACFHKFKTINFAEDVDKNIDIKKHVSHDCLKSKSRRFAQLEKNISQHVSIDIYDINGETIGKKYDFRCNQNLNKDGKLVDEFAPEDFYCDDDVSVKEKSYRLSCDAASCTESSAHDESNENVNTFAESERDDDSPEDEISELMMSLESSQHNLSSSTDIGTDNTLVKTPMNISGDSSLHDMTLTNLTCPNTPTDTNSPITNIDNTISNNNDLEDQCLNNNIKGTIDVGSLLDSPPESVNSKGRRTSSTDDPALLSDTNGDANSCVTPVQNTPLNGSKKNQIQRRSTAKSNSKLLKKKLPASCKKQQSITKRNLLHALVDPLYSRRGRPNMFKKGSRACMKCIRECDPFQYEDVTNAELNLLGFRLHVNTLPDACINDDVTANNDNDNVTSSIDEDRGSISESFHSPSPTCMSPSPESFGGFVPLRSDSPQDWLVNRPAIDGLDKRVSKWHDMIQPKLRDAEKRATFCIHDYASRIMETLKTSGQCKINFDTVVQKEHPCEVARYFLASLDLAAKQNIDISTSEDLEHNIEIVLPEDKQCSTNNPADSHD